MKDKEREVRSGRVHGREEREMSTGRCETAWWLDEDQHRLILKKRGDDHGVEAELLLHEQIEE